MGFAFPGVLDKVGIRYNEILINNYYPQEALQYLINIYYQQILLISYSFSIANNFIPVLILANDNIISYLLTIVGLVVLYTTRYLNEH